MTSCLPWKCVALASIIHAISLVPASEDCLAGDVSRKGMVLAVGAGFAPLAQFSGELGRENGGAFAFNFNLGYAFDEHNPIVGEFAGVYRKSELYSHFARYYVPGVGGTIGYQWITQAFAGPAWYHFYGSVGRSLYTVIGIGMPQHGTTDIPGNDAGFGGIVGTGYEFERHLRIGVQFAMGESTNRSDKLIHLQLAGVLAYSTGF